jgi:hypothetical protein
MIEAALAMEEVLERSVPWPLLFLLMVDLL